LIPDVGEEVLALGFGVEKSLILFGGNGEVTIDLATVEAEVKDAPGRLVGLSGQELRFQGPPESRFSFSVSFRIVVGSQK